METKVVTAHLPLELAEQVDEYAAQLDRPRGWIVKQALAAWIDREEEKLRLTLEAVADVDAGGVVDDDKVGEWIESLDTDKSLPLPAPSSAPR